MKNGAVKIGIILRCVLLSFVVTVILSGILAAIVCFCRVDESAVRIIIFLMMILSVFFSAYVLAKNIDRAGMLNGLIMAAVYFSIIVLFSFAANGKISFKITDLLRFITLVSAGMLGGIIGINT